MKRVLAVLLCILCAMLLLVACGDEVDTDTDTNTSTDTSSDTNQGTDNTDKPGHTHTYKTNADWSKDAQGHWYDATCDCEDAPITKLNHTDANNDGACDVCTYTNHEHEYSEEWTADCTNHWNAADCGHVVPGANVAPHEDSDEDGRCDVCNYIIEDIHEHYYSTEWTTDGSYHWHAALCEHKVEVTGKEAHAINAAGFCTVCNQKLKEIDKADILAVLEAAVANNYKVISGNVNFSEIVYGTATSIENKGTDEVFFVLGNGDSYILLKNYNKDDTFIGGEQQYFETISEEEIFGVKVEIGSIDLKPTSGLATKLNGYNYTPGSILAAGYDDNSTLAQTIANLYDLMSKGDHIANSKTNYDPKTGKYSFSYEYLAVNATEQHSSGGTGGEAVMDYQVYLYYVDVEFTVNDDMVINLCNFSVESYRNWEMDTDLVYYPETDTYKLLETASPTIYTYEVSQTSGERTYTTIYPKASFMPIDFELSLVTKTDYNDAGQMYVKEETPILDIDGDGIGDLTLNKETFTRLHIGGLVPSSAIPSFMDVDDFEVTCENLDEGNGLLWGTGLYQTPTYSGYMDCISFRTSTNSGKFLVTIRFGQVTKKICVTIPGEPTVTVPDDTDDTKYVQVTTPWGYEDKYTFTAKESGTYTFTLPVGLGFVFEGADAPEYDPFDPIYADQNEHTVVFELAKGESVTFFVGAEEKGIFAIGVAFKASEVENPNPDTPVVPSVTEKPLNENGSNAVNGANVAFAFTASSNGVLTIKYGGFVAMGGGTPSGTVTYSINGGEAIDVVDGSVENKIDLNKDDKIVITVISDCYATIISAWAGESTGEEGGLQGSGTEDDPYIIPEAGDYVCAFPGQSDVVWYKYTITNGGYVTVSTTFGEGGWIKLGKDTIAYENNEGNGEPLSSYFPADSVIYIGIGDYNESTTDISFKVAYEEVKSDAIDDIVGTWTGTGTLKWGTVTYTLTINADGTGTLLYNEGYDVSCTVDYVIKNGSKVTIGYTGSWSIGTIECTYENDTFTCTSGIYGESFVFAEGTASGGGDDSDDDEIAYDTVIVVGSNKLWFSEAEISADTATRPLIIVTAGNYSFNAGALFISTITDSTGNQVTKNADYTFDLAAGEYTVTFSMLSMFGVPADTAQELNLVNNSASGDEGDDDDNTGDDNTGDTTSDPLSSTVEGTYRVDGYTLSIYDFEGYVANVTNADGVDLTFTFTVTDNGDNTYTLTLTHKPNEFETGTEKLDEILAVDWTISIDPFKKQLEGTSLTIGDYSVYFSRDYLTGEYLIAISHSWDTCFYFTYTATDIGDGTYKLNQAYFAHENECGDKDAHLEAMLALDIVVEVEIPNEDDTVEGGTYETPIEITEAGDYVAPFKGGYNYVYYKYTVNANGYITISTTHTAPFFQYGTSIDNLTNNEGPSGTLSSAKIYAFAGQTIYIAIGDGNFTESAMDIPFTVSFEAFESEDPSFLKGTWNGAQVSMQGVTPYNFTIDAEGKGTGSYTQWGQATEFVINYILVDGNNVTINVTTGGLYAQELSFSLVYDEETDTLSGDINLEKTKALGLESYQINAVNDKYIYYATQNIVINLKVGASVMDGNVTVSYSVNGGEVKTLTFNENADVELNMGDKLTVVITADTYSSLTASRVYPLGSQQNPIKIESLPFDMTHLGNEGEKYYIYTATEDIIITITCPEGCLVSGTGVSKDDNGNYVVALTKGASLTLNPWANTADTSADSTYTYTVTGEIPEVEEPGEGGDSTSTTYLSASNSGRYIMFEISGTTLTVTRSDMTGNFGTGGAATAVYTLSGSGADTTATRVSGTICTFVFDDNGLPTTITWSGKAYTDFVKQ